MSEATFPIHTEASDVHSSCVACHRPIHSHDGTRGWIHTSSGTYRCPTFPFGWADPGKPRDIEAVIQAAAAEAEVNGYDEGFADGKAEGRDDGHQEGVAEGRQQMHDELTRALTSFLAELGDRVAGDPAVVRRALVRAWNRVTP